MMSTISSKLTQKANAKSKEKHVRLRLVYINVRSAIKISFLAALALGIVTVVVFFIVYMLVTATGLLGKADDLVTAVSDGDFAISSFAGLPQVLAISVIISVINLVVITLLGGVVAAIYNFAVKITGGLLLGFSSQ